MADTPESILAEAERITSNEGEQRRYYGSPAVNAGRAAQLWTAYVQGKYGVELELSASDVSVLMILLKVAREANAPKRDNRVDIAGWAAVLDACEEGS